MHVTLVRIPIFAQEKRSKGIRKESQMVSNTGSLVSCSYNYSSFFSLLFSDAYKISFYIFERPQYVLTTQQIIGPLFGFDKPKKGGNNSITFHHAQLDLSFSEAVYND